MTGLVSCRVAAGAALLLLAGHQSLLAEPSRGRPLAQGASPNVVFTHSGCPVVEPAKECRSSFVLDLADREPFIVRIRSTEPDNYSYTIAGVVLERSATAKRQAGGDTLPSHDLPQQHDKRFGGYVVTIRKKSSTTGSLPEATLLISVRTNEWKTSFGGGFTFTNLVGNAYAIRDKTTAATATTPASVTSTLVRDDARKDEAAYGAATFVHLFHSAHESIAASFGLGLSLNGATGTAYYAGPSFRFGDKGALTIGAVVGPVRTLPAGLHEDDTIQDRTTVANALATPPTRNAVKAFFAFSYTFLGGGQSELNKPLAGGAGGASPP